MCLQQLLDRPTVSGGKLKLFLFLLLLTLENAAAQEVPALSFHQSRHSSISQTYSVDVRVSGRVIYQGGENTRRPQFAVFDIDPVQLQKLISELDALQLMPVVPSGTPMSVGRTLDLAYISSGLRKTFVFPDVMAQGVKPNSATEYRVRELLEQYIPIENFRCPSWQDYYELKPPQNLKEFPEICEIERKIANGSKKFVETELNILRGRSISK